METLPLVLRNTFLTNTEESYKKCLELTHYHYDALTAHMATPFFADCRDFYRPYHDKFLLEYTEWSSARSTQQGDTLSVKQMIEDLRGERIDNWDIRVQAVYNKKSPKYKSIFPNGRKPFQHGGQEDMIAAVDTLLSNIGTDSGLASLKTEIQGFSDNLSAAQSTKIGKFTITKTAVDEVEDARIDVCNAMYKNLLDIASHYYLNPAQAAPYFNWEVLRPGEQTVFIAHVKPAVAKFIAKRTLQRDDQILVENTGIVAVSVSSVDNKDAQSGAPAITIAADETKTFSAAEIGNSLERPYIIAINTDETRDAHLKMVLL